MAVAFTLLWLHVAPAQRRLASENSNCRLLGTSYVPGFTQWPRVLTPTDRVGVLPEATQLVSGRVGSCRRTCRAALVCWAALINGPKPGLNLRNPLSRGLQAAGPSSRCPQGRFLPEMRGVPSPLAGRRVPPASASVLPGLCPLPFSVPSLPLPSLVIGFRATWVIQNDVILRSLT